MKNTNLDFPDLKIYPLLLFLCLLAPMRVYSAQLESYSEKIQPIFVLSDLNGKTHQLQDYRGKVVLINFWASWCLPCLGEMRSMRRLADSLNRQEFVLLTLNSTDSARRITEVLKSLHLDIPVLLDTDSEVFKALQAKVLPTSYLLDHNGRLAYRMTGPADWEDANIVAKIKQLIQER